MSEDQKDHQEQNRENVRQRAARLRQGIYDSYHRLITSSQLTAGSKLPTERTLASEFGTTRKTVREAMTMLEADGLISRQVGAGTFVCNMERVDDEPRSFVTPSVSPMDVIETRLVIEPALVQLAVRRATQEDFIRMDKSLTAMMLAPNQMARKAAGYNFHLAVVKATRNSLLVTMYEMLIAARERAGWGMLFSLDDREEFKDQQVDTARTILQALKDRDVKRAQSAYQIHLNRILRSATSSPPLD